MNIEKYNRDPFWMNKTNINTFKHLLKKHFFEHYWLNHIRKSTDRITLEILTLRNLTQLFCSFLFSYNDFLTKSVSNQHIHPLYKLLLNWLRLNYTLIRIRHLVCLDIILPKKTASLLHNLVLNRQSTIEKFLLSLQYLFYIHLCFRNYFLF